MTGTGRVATGRIRSLLLLAVLPAVLMSGCGGDDASNDASSTDAPPVDPGAVGEVTVSAAASLTDVFEQIGDAFVMANPDAEVTFNFGSSGQLSTQIVEGAPADVAAFADTAPMDALDDADVLAAPPEIFATNELVLVTPPGNPAGLRSLADLPGAGIVSLCVETAPCGKFASQLLSVARVTLDEAAVSRGQDVRSTLTAVTEGDADAAIVYVTDAAAAGDAVEVVTVPEAADVVATYPIAALAAAAAPEVARSFVDFVLGEEGQRLLSEAGFGPP